MAQILGPTEHCGKFRNGFLFHCRRSATAIERVIVRVDPLRQRVSQPCYRMWRLEHLPGVERMKIGEIVVKALGRFREHGADSVRGWWLHVVRWERRKSSI